MRKMASPCMPGDVQLESQLQLCPDVFSPYAIKRDADEADAKPGASKGSQLGWNLKAGWVDGNSCVRE